jgi:transcriptional regulatory protein RtcR
MNNRPLVVIGLLGPVLDMGKRESRWKRWRPTVALCGHRSLPVHRFELLYQKKFSNLMKRVVADIGEISPETEVAPRLVELENPWDFEEVFGVLHDFAAGYPFDPDREDYLVHITTGTHVAQICLFLLSESRHFPARLLQTGPGREKKPMGEYAVIDLDLSRYDRIAMRFRKERRDDISFLKSGIETRNPAFNALMERIERVAARTADPMLLTGPTGAGKTALARRIFELKRGRRQMTGRFAEVNCATLRGDMAMSTLFGHEKGAFTGAVNRREGMLRAAEGGVLFLDEVGELGGDEQSMLLMAIEEKRFFPVGSDREASSEFQLICGTNRDLRREVAAGRFRADLLARINLWTFPMPGLRDRPEDIAPNLDFELEKYARRAGTRVTFNAEARRRFLEFAISEEAAWSANFRDLNGAVTRMATLCRGGRITAREVEEEIERLRSSWSAEKGEAASDDSEILREALGEEGAGNLDRFDRVQLADVLTAVRESRSLSEAGRTLFAVSRRNKEKPNDADRLRKYLAKFGIDWRAVR